MKNILTTCALLVAVISLPFNVLAHDATIELQFIGGVPVVPGGTTLLVVPYLPYTIDFDGVISHEGEGNLNRIELLATVNDDVIYGPELFKGGGNATSAPFSIPWTITKAGTYVIAIYGTHTSGTAHENCPAAPAVAAEYLKVKGANGDATKNVIPTIAKETGKGGAFFAKEKCVVDYEERVITVVESML